MDASFLREPVTISEKLLKWFILAAIFTLMLTLLGAIGFVPLHAWLIPPFFSWMLIAFLVGDLVSSVARDKFMLDHIVVYIVVIACALFMGPVIGGSMIHAHGDPPMFDVPRQDIYGDPDFKNVITFDTIPDGTEVVHITSRPGNNPNDSIYPVPEEEHLRRAFFQNLAKRNIRTRTPFTREHVRRGPFRHRSTPKKK
jgi:hypothetical protein